MAVPQSLLVLHNLFEKFWSVILWSVFQSGFVRCVLSMRLVICVIGKGSTRATCPSQCIRSEGIWCQLLIITDHLATVICASFSTIKLRFSFLKWRRVLGEILWGRNSCPVSSPQSRPTNSSIHRWISPLCSSVALFLSFILNLLIGNVSGGKHCPLFRVIDLAFLLFFFF